MEDHGTDMESDHTYTSRGRYSTSLVLIDDKGCTVVADGDVKIVVNDTTKIDFASPTCIFEGEGFTLESIADESDLIWEWLINDKLAGTTGDLSMALYTAGEHRVTLKAINQ